MLRGFDKESFIHNFMSFISEALRTNVRSQSLAILARPKVLSYSIGSYFIKIYYSTELHTY